MNLGTSNGYILLGVRIGHTGHSYSRVVDAYSLAHREDNHVASAYEAI